MYSSISVGMSCLMESLIWRFSVVDGEDLGFDDLAGAKHVGGVVEATVGGDFADVNEAFDAFGDLHEGSEVHELGDGALDLRADGEVAGDLGPGVGEGLLESERDAALLGLDAENDGIDAVARLEHVARVAELFAVGHFGDMDQAFDAGLDLDKCAEVHEAGDGAGDALAGGERDGLPGFGLKLLEAEGDFLGFRIDFEDS